MRTEEVIELLLLSRLGINEKVNIFDLASGGLNLHQTSRANPPQRIKKKKKSSLQQDNSFQQYLLKTYLEQVEDSDAHKRRHKVKHKMA